MMGVHGNGLTSLIWMKPSPRSTVMEFFFPQGFAHDYEYTTRALGMVHYGFWNSEYVPLSSSRYITYFPLGTSLAPLYQFQNTLRVSKEMSSPSMAKQSPDCAWRG